MPGFGVIATQSMGEPMYGELGLDALRAGLTAAEALKALRSIDPHPERRQVAMVDSYGGVDVYTGDACIAEAGHYMGECCAALANMMQSDQVWKAMVDTFEAAAGTLASRLLEALRSAERHGGDLRGSRSAAILVVRAQRSGRPWQDNLVDLRVDDHPEPVTVLADMLSYSDRYHKTVKAFELALDDRSTEALDLIMEVGECANSEPELMLWHAIVMAKAGRMEDATQLMERLTVASPEFVETARRFGPARLVNADLLDRILPLSAKR